MVGGELEVPGVPGHRGEVFPMYPDPDAEAFASCSCGWQGDIAESARAAEVAWGDHAAPPAAGTAEATADPDGDQDRDDEDGQGEGAGPVATATDVRELAGQLRRAVAALADAEPTAAVRLLARLGAWVGEASADAVAAARAAGASWPEIAEAAGVSKQTAHARWARPRRRTDEGRHAGA